MNFIHNIVWISPIRYLRPFQPWNIFAESHSVSCTTQSQPVVLSCRKSRTSYLFSKTVKKAEGPSQFLSLCAFQTYKISTSVNIEMKNFEHRNNMKTCREPSFNYLIREGLEPLRYVRSSVCHTCGQRGLHSGRATKN